MGKSWCWKPCLGGVVVLSQDAVCAQTANPNAPIAGPPSMPGTAVAINKDAQTIEVDLTQAYRVLVEKKRPDYGLMLYPSLESNPGERGRTYTNAETYAIKLEFRFVKDVIP